MQLSKRLQAVASLVTPGNRVADVGCDHAYTAIYLTEKHISPHVIAMDVNQGPIDRAKINIIKYGFGDRIDVRKSDGLEKLNEHEADTILIAGMGGALTIQILSKRMEVVRNIRELVLQPQSEIHLVRQMLCEIGFLITSENMLLEDGKYYVMMRAQAKELVTDEKTYELTEEEHFYFGRLLLEQRHPVLMEYLVREQSICENIMREFLSETTEKSRLRQQELKEKIDRIVKGRGYYNN
ncbi:MAG: hypothetical protein K0S76_1383 [Herbinix sp.]|jgi:tRNA (adenine22-N1)-methyltransferase|nr:hypothetical protein [Herbinix sp.]